MSHNEPAAATVLGYSRTRLLRILVGFPAAGLGIGFLLPPVARWVDGSATGPLRRVAAALGGLDQPWQIALCALAATAFGLLAAYVAVADATRLTVTEDALVLAPRDGRKATTLARADVAAVYLDRRDLVVLDAAGRELARGPRQASRHALSTALLAHGHPWRDEAPATPQPTAATALTAPLAAPSLTSR
ncbi:YqeB family protein [Streptomyces cremeus]|uniref:YqeB PH domain-containing protein n=1 Tax=Streptomyces cremeus TaxID=66881 RepID=A0ABV5P8B5_STRCM